MEQRIEPACARCARSRAGTATAAEDTLRPPCGPTPILPCVSRRSCARLYNRGSMPIRRHRRPTPAALAARRCLAARLRSALAAIAGARGADGAGAARRRRLDLRRLRPARRHGLGRPARGAARRRERYPHRVVNASISGDTTAGGRARLPALLAQHKPAIVVIELGGNDGLRGGNLAVDARQSRRDGRRRAEARAPRSLLVGMQLPPNYGPAYVARVRRAVRRASRRRARRRSCPFFFEGFGERQRAVPARPHPSDGRGAAEAARQRLAGAAAAARASADDAHAALHAARRRKVGVDALADYPGSHRRAQPVRVRRRPPPRRREPSGARRRRARAHRHAARAGVGVRRASAPARRSSRATSPRCSRRAFADKPRDWAPLVYCWRGGQRSALARARAERDRLARGAARRRLSRVPPPRRRRSSRRCRRASASRSICGLTGSGKSRLLRRARRRRRAGARPRSARAASRLAAGRPARRSAAVAEGVRQRAPRGARALRSGASGVRRVGEQEDRHRAGARRAARRDARRRLHPPRHAAAAARRAAQGRVRALPRRSGSADRAARASRSAARAARRSSAGPPRPRPATGTRWSASCSSATTIPTYARSIERNFPRIADALASVPAGIGRERLSARSRASSTPGRSGRARSPRRRLLR